MTQHSGTDELHLVQAGDVQAAQAASNQLGMFFRLPETDGQSDAWEPLGLLYTNSGSAHLKMLLESVLIQLNSTEVRVAASLFYQGLASRLLSPKLGCTALGGCVPQMMPEQVFWRRPQSLMIELAATPDRKGWAGRKEPLIDLIVAATFEEHLEPLGIALRRHARIPDSLLRDNAASALVSGLRLLSAHLGSSWLDLALHALALPQLCGSGAFQQETRSFVRRSCCLYYRTPAGMKCGDCPIA